MSDQVFLVNSSSFQDVEVSASLRAGPGITVDFTQATNVTGTFSGLGTNLVNVSASYIVPNKNTSASFALSASYSGTASVLLGSSQFAQFATSASWVSASNKITTSDTASFVTASNVVGVLTATQAPIAVSASWVSASNKITTADTASFVTASNIVGVLTVAQAPIAISASWVSASNFITTAQTASYISSSATFDNKVYNHTASNASLASQVSVVFTESNATFYIPFVQNSGSQTLYMDTASIYYNPGTDLLTVTNVSASSVTASLLGTASYATSASYALTASNVTTLYNYVFSGSADFTTTLATGVATSMSFLVGANQTWECDAHLTIANSGNKGILYAISSSNSGASTGSIEGWIFGTLAAGTFLSQRIVAANALTTTAADTVTTTPGFVQYHFSVNNPTAPATISVAVANQPPGNTITVYRGSYLLARRTI